MNEPRTDASAWALWRQDDNGNRFVIAHFATHEEADAERARFEALGHKQTYWVQPRGAEDARHPSTSPSTIPSPQG